MDLDAYSAAHDAEWKRLAQLSSASRLDGRQADELIDLYQAGAAHLSAIKTTVGESVPGDRLSLTLSRARLKFTGTSSNALMRVTQFFALQLPAALYRVRWITVGVGVYFVAVAAFFGYFVASDPQVIASLGSYEALRSYAENDFTGYYSASSEGVFAAQVWTNNAYIAAQCIAFGITGLWVPYAMFMNAQSIGQSAGIMAEFGRLDEFFLFIAPHGQLEIYSLLVAAAAGLLIFWSWVAPGARTRGQALAEDGRAFFAIVIGVILSLLVSGLVEGIVTRQEWPWVIKIGIGSIVWIGFLVYQWWWGRRAFRAGHTGDLDEFEAGARRLVAG
ncbi:MAG: stage II sporulation protein M [Microbacteriaceae bacterium]